MPMSGAIFDCDGTIVDSMGMWSTVFDVICERYGVAPDPAFFGSIETLSLRDECAALHGEKHVGTSADALYEEVCAYVTDKYEHEILTLPGCEAFLRTMHEAGIPMAVASSTPAREVRRALEAHGLWDCFDAVVSTEDVGGRDKEYPDVYLEALRRLGTDRETTWVFEDAPFGVQTSKRAGFHVVAVFNERDGRDEKAIRPYADIFVHGYPELSLSLIRDFADTPAHVEGVMRALVVDGSPCPSSPALVRSLALAADYVIAADRGAEVLRAAEVAPDVFCGDSDSVGERALAWARTVASSQIGFPPEKYSTDLSIAIDCARHEAKRRGQALQLTVTCATGGRPDHAFGVVGLLARAADASPRLVEDGYELRVVSPEGTARWQLGEDAVGGVFSAFAVAPDTVISEEGMKWDLDHHEMGLLDDLGVSNVIEAKDAVVECSSGAVAAFLLR
jgi:thiamine pyrophosphokinase